MFLDLLEEQGLHHGSECYGGRMYAQIKHLLLLISLQSIWCMFHFGKTSKKSSLVTCEAVLQISTHFISVTKVFRDVAYEVLRVGSNAKP